MPVSVTFTYRNISDPAQRKPTIYEALRAKLGREPSNAELNADVRRILDEAMCERAKQGKLRHQRRA